MVHTMQFSEQNLTQAEERISLAIEPYAKQQVLFMFEPTVQKAEIHVSVGDYASLTLLCVQPSGVQQHIVQRNTVAEGAALHCQNITLGAEVEHTIESDLQGANAESSVDWLAYAKNSERHVLSAVNRFNAPQGAGEMTIKSVAEDQARIACSGLIDIGASGGGTDTYLTEDVLMLDTTCIVDAIPGLEIKTNDVKASHSATVSKVTPADLFYFQSRGIAERQAREMYVVGFLGGLLNRIPNTLPGRQAGEYRNTILESITEKYRTTSA